MKTLAALLSTALLGLCAGCGSAGRKTVSVPPRPSGAVRSGVVTPANTSTATNAAPIASSRKVDDDNDDNENLSSDDNNSAIRSYGQEASTADRPAIVALVKRYYATALAENGARACTMISPGLVRAAPLDYGKFGPPYVRGGKSCAAIASKLFEHQHKTLVDEIPRLHVVGVRLKGTRGFALVNFGSMPEREVAVFREHRIWRVGGLLDSELP